MDSLNGIRYGAVISDAAKRHGLDPRLLAAVAAQETGGPGTDSGRNVVGDGGHGRGLFQIDDRWHAFARTAAAMDPAKNADYAAGMLSDLVAKYGGNLHAALSAYNAGSPGAIGTTTDWGDGKPVGYADSVLKHLARIDDSASTGSREAASHADRFRANMDALRSLAYRPAVRPQAACGPLTAGPRWTADGRTPPTSASEPDQAGEMAAASVRTTAETPDDTV